MNTKKSVAFNKHRVLPFLVTLMLSVAVNSCKEKSTASSRGKILNSPATKESLENQAWQMEEKYWVYVEENDTISYKKLWPNEIIKEFGHKIDMDSILIARQIQSQLHFELSDSITLKLIGKIKNDSVFITAKRKPLEIKNFRLMKRGFHWITEAPYFY